jgi:hypothetical protein
MCNWNISYLMGFCAQVDAGDGLHSLYLKLLHYFSLSFHSILYYCLFGKVLCALWWTILKCMQQHQAWYCCAKGTSHQNYRYVYSFLPFFLITFLPISPIFFSSLPLSPAIIYSFSLSVRPFFLPILTCVFCFLLFISVST